MYGPDYGFNLVNGLYKHLWWVVGGVVVCLGSQDDHALEISEYLQTIGGIRIKTHTYIH